MPGRNGHAVTGGWATETSMVNGYSVSTDLTLDSRPDNTPTEYVAAHTITFNPGFESGTDDDFTAYIADSTYEGSSGSGSSDDEANSGRYRYGFNGKENDNEVKGEGNQQDYGMRIYDPRLGRFLSFDPLFKEYNDLSPYHFAGNNPIQNLDRDGGEPQDYMQKWKFIRFSTNGGGLTYSKTINDPQLGYIDVEAVYDNWSKRSWFIHQGNDGSYYYWKHNPGADQSVRMEGNGKWEEFKTQNRIQYEATVSLNRGISTFFAVAVSAPFIAAAVVEGAVAVNAAVSTGITNIALTIYRNLPAIGSAGTGLAKILDESGGSGVGAVENAGTSFFTEKAIKKSGQWIEAVMKFTGKSGNSRIAEFGGIVKEEGKNMIVEAALYIKGLTNKEAAGELGREGLNAVKNEFKEFAKKQGYEKLIINFTRSEGSSSANPGSSQQWIINLNE